MSVSSRCTVSISSDVDTVYNIKSRYEMQLLEAPAYLYMQNGSHHYVSDDQFVGGCQSSEAAPVSDSCQSKLRWRIILWDDLNVYQFLWNHKSKVDTKSAKLMTTFILGQNVGLFKHTFTFKKWK